MINYNIIFKCLFFDLYLNIILELFKCGLEKFYDEKILWKIFYRLICKDVFSSICKCRDNMVWWKDIIKSFFKKNIIYFLKKIIFWF